MHHLLCFCVFAAMFLCLAPSSHATVFGRYIYFGNALSETMGLAEVEVYSEGENIIAKRPEVFTEGLDYGFWMKKRTPEQKAEAGLKLVDGDTDTSVRCVDFGPEIGGGYLDIALRYSSFEIDLGFETFIDSVSIYRSQYTQKQWGDLGWRILVVMDENRKIISWKTFNVYGDDWKLNNGRWNIPVEPATAEGDAIAGREIPLGVRSWLSEAEFIRDCLGKPVEDLLAKMTPEVEARLERFKHRNDPDQIDALGREFFRRVDLDAPGLEAVRELVQAGKFAAALEAFKAPFLARLEPLKDWNAGEGTSIYVFYTWTTQPDTRYTGRSRDLRNHIFADRKELTVKRFVPGLLPPAKLSFPFQMRPLLLNYAVSGSAEDLDLWEEMTDDWSMGFQDAADKDPENLRDYFVLDPGLKGNLKDLYMASQSRPEFAEQLSGATLARFLMPVLEEVLVANWRVTRKVNFNHTFNCIPGGLTMASLLDEFHAGKRLGREMQQAFERLYTLSLYRDGSMVEIGDEGHYLATAINPGNLYGNFVHKGRPEWFTPALETYFLDHYRANLLSHVRNISPHGNHVRWNAENNALLYLDYELDIKDSYWRNVSGGRMTWGDYYPLLTKPILLEKEPRAIVDTVYGRGRPTFTDNTKQKEQKALAETYGGEYEGAPGFLSDWMPYTGLWYFRGGWEREAAFLHMVKPGNANNNGGAILYPVTNRYGAGQFNDTTYRFSDYATPLVTGLGVLIDGLPPCPEETRAPSGSKQDSFTQAIEKPQQGRWHTDADLDFGEALMQVNYRRIGLEFDHKLRKTYVDKSEKSVNDVTTTRQIFQIRGARLFLQLDRLRYSDDAPHTNTLEDTVILTGPGDGEKAWTPDTQITLQADAKRIDSNNYDSPGLTMAHFGQAGLSIDVDTKSLAHGSFSKYGEVPTLNGTRSTTGRLVTSTWTASGETALLTLLRSRPAGEEPVSKLEDLSTDSVIGTRATMHTGTRVSLLVARRIPAALELGSITANGEALLVVEEPHRDAYGMVLGAASFSVDGKVQAVTTAPGTATADLRFSLDAERACTTVAIRRPLDPPTVGPAVNTFTDTTTVTISSESADVDLYYIAESMADTRHAAPYSARIDGEVGGPARASASLKEADWKPYTGPFTITESSFIRARAIRKGVETIPFTADGTDVSAISYGFFEKRAAKPAAAKPAKALMQGLDYDYLEGRWFALWTYTDQLEAKATGSTDTLLDVSMRATDGPFAVRYTGFLDIPADGVYTFYGPDEYVNNLNAPGYDLRVFIDGEEWYLTQFWHGRGTWSVPLQKGLHSFRVTFADARAKDLEAQPIELWRHYPWADTTWKGVTPTLDIAGPGLERQPLPQAWLKH